MGCMEAGSGRVGSTCAHPHFAGRRSSSAGRHGKNAKHGKHAKHGTAWRTGSYTPGPLPEMEAEGSMPSEPVSMEAWRQQSGGQAETKGWLDCQGRLCRGRDGRLVGAGWV